jgi:type IV secretion system protein VirB10
MTDEKAGVQVQRGEKQTNSHSKRIILVFIILVGVIISLITMQARFKLGGSSDAGAAKIYRTPPASGFAELVASIRRDREPAKTKEPAAPSWDVRTQRIVIEGKKEGGVIPALPYAPRYYSNEDDARIARTLMTMKVQAMTARPLVEDFKKEENDKGASESVTYPGRLAPASPTADPAAMMDALRQGQSQNPNGQTAKQDFLRAANGAASLTPQGYSESVPFPQQFPYELKAGTLIPGILITGINSDLPGNVAAQVSENVWDTATGRYVLIPKGTRILGVYDSQITFGQRRVLLVWNRLVFPNGTTLDIAGSPGIDQAGYSGLSGKVDEHWGTMLKSALLASVFIAGAEIVYDGDSNGNGENKSPGDVAAESAAGAILDMGAKLMNRAADIQPTITIRPGKKMGIFVQRDVVFPYPYEL